MKSRMISMGICTALAFGVNSAKGQDALEEIIVTAERRSVSIQDVALTIEAYSGEELETKGVTSVVGLQTVTPNLVITDQTGFVIPYIRGTGSSTIGAGIFASVATYVDDVYVSQQTSASFDLANVENVQVLMGPQGALYGRNATAGALVISTVTPTPGDEFNGRISVGAGKFGATTGSLRLAGSLSDTLAAQFTASFNKRDGFIKNDNPDGFGLYSEDSDDRDTKNYALALNFEPNDEFGAVFRASYWEAFDRAGCCYQAVGQNVFPGILPGLNSNQTAIGLTAAQLLGPQLGLSPEQAFGLGAAVGASAVFTNGVGRAFDGFRGGWDNGLLNGKHPGGSGFFNDGTAVSLAMTYDFGSFIGKSITAYTDNNYHGSTTVSVEGPGLGVDPDGPGPIPFIALNGGIGFSADSPSDNLSQEFRLLSKDNAARPWIVGLAYNDQSGSNDLTGDFFGTSLYSARADYDVESIALYGQIDFPITDRFGVTIGGRYTDEEYTLDDRLVPFNPADPTTFTSFPGVPNVGSLEQSDSNFTYTLRGQYEGDSWLAYASLATGFKSGSLNVNNPVAGSAAPEEITSFELGFKSDLTDTLRFNTALFVYDYKDIQQSLVDDGSGATFLINGGGADIIGLDVDLTALISDNLSLSVNATVLDTEFTEDGVLALTGSTLAIEGNRLPGAPENGVSLSAEWQLPFVTNGSLVLNGSYNYNSGYFLDVENRIGTGGTDDSSYSLANFNLRYTAPSENWDVAIWGNNIFDDEYFRTGVVAVGFSLLGIAGNPENYGISATYRF